MSFREHTGSKPSRAISTTAPLLVIAFLVSACASLPAGATETPIPPPPTSIPATATIVPPTDTPEPTPTATPTITPIPSLAVAPEGMDSWCLPIIFGMHADGPNGPDSAPQGARPGVFDKGTGVLNLHIPAITCTVVYIFNQPMPPGTMLSIYDFNKTPFMEVPLNTAASNPIRGYATLSHPYIIDPPFWWQDFTFVVTAPDGKEMHRIPVHVFKSLPDPCWDGSLPNPVTLFCPIEDS